ncbi:MAG: hypothetical protein JNM88_04185 [Chitinophagaceae bacterium]|nr:hypothetical protein [Chitinophagaceae bacterium]
MILAEIQKEVEKLGFSASIKEDILICGKNPQKDEQTGIITLENAFGISIVNNQAVLGYFRGQIAQEAKFKSVNLLMEYIIKKFSDQ